MTKTTSRFTRSDDDKDIFSRSVSFDLSRANKENGKIPVTISTETPIRTNAGMEVLSHEESAIDLSRILREGLPLLVDHAGEAVGRVVEIVLKNKKLQGFLTFSRSVRGQELLKDVLDKIITDISVGGKKQKTTELKNGAYTVTRWQPLEASLTAVGADSNAGINRKFKTGEEMTPEEIEALKKAEKEKGAKIERKRRKDVTGVFTRHLKIDGVDAIQQECLNDDVSVERSRELLLEHLGKDVKPKNQNKGNAFEIGETDADKFEEGIHRALCLRAGCATDDEKKDIGNNPFTSFTPVEMARSYLQINGINATGMSRMQVVGDAFIMRGGHTSSDFPAILADVANKSMLKGYNEIPETWTSWAQVGNLNDFKEAKRVNLSAFSGLSEVPEGAEYSYGDLSDLAESIILLTYGKLFQISRQALVNDDLSALSRIPMAMGRSAQRKVGDLAYAPLFANPNMGEDGNPLFHASHNNDFDTTAPTVETLDEMRVAMGLQKDPSENAVLGIRPANIIVPFELEGLTRTLIKAQYDPATDAGTLTPNPEMDLLNVIAEHRLSANSATAWYLSALSTMTDTIEVAFLDGNQNPFIEQQEGFTRDGVSYKVRIDAGVAPLDYRGLSRNLGSN